MKPILLLFILALAVSHSFSQIQNEEPTNTLTYSELYKSRDSYLGKRIRLSANYIYGFEWQFLCGDNDDCRKRNRNVWVEFLDDDDLCKGSKRKVREGSSKYFDNRAEVVFVGRLTEGKFGHHGAYRHQFVVDCVEKFEKRKPLI